MLNILVIVGSSRPGRKAEAVAKWFTETASSRTDMQFTVADLAEENLPFLDEPLSPMMGQYANDHTKAWAAKLAAADGFVLVTPEYNHAYPAVLKNALDFAYAEWNRKPVAFVSYGVMSGVRAVEQLKQVVIQLEMAPLNSQVAINLFTAWDKDGTFTPSDNEATQATKLLDELQWWGNALKAARK